MGAMAGPLHVQGNPHATHCLALYAPGPGGPKMQTSRGLHVGVKTGGPKGGPKCGPHVNFT